MFPGNLSARPNVRSQAATSGQHGRVPGGRVAQPCAAAANVPSTAAEEAPTRSSTAITAMPPKKQSVVQRKAASESPLLTASKPAMDLRIRISAKET